MLSWHMSMPCFGSDESAPLFAKNFVTFVPSHGIPAFLDSSLHLRTVACAPPCLDVNRTAMAAAAC